MISFKENKSQTQSKEIKKGHYIFLKSAVHQEITIKYIFTNCWRTYFDENNYGA